MVRRLLRDGVADVEVEVVGLVAAEALAEHLRPQVGRRVLDREDHVARPQRAADGASAVR